MCSIIQPLVSKLGKNQLPWRQSTIMFPTQKPLRCSVDRQLQRGRRSTMLNLCCARHQFRFLVTHSLLVFCPSPRVSKPHTSDSVVLYPFSLPSPTEYFGLLNRMSKAASLRRALKGWKYSVQRVPLQHEQPLFSLCIAIRPELFLSLVLA